MGLTEGIFVCLGNVGSISRRNSFAIYIMALFVALPYVKFGIFCAGDWRMCIMSDVACQRYVPDVIVGNGTCWGNSRVSSYPVPPVEFM